MPETASDREALGYPTHDPRIKYQRVAVIRYVFPVGGIGHSTLKLNSSDGPFKRNAEL
jgi:hypothetical protein